MDATVFIYGEEALLHLKKKDAKLGNFMEEVGRIERETTPDLFTSLTSSFISQQISGRAAESIFSRFEELCEGNISPEKVVSLDTMDIKSCGMSLKKAEYVQAAAQAFLSGELELDNIEELTDEEIIKKLTTLRGVGVWTVEMLLIFTLQRPNVLSYGDYGIKSGIMKLYNWKTVSKKRWDMLAKRYAPYASIASFYLWHRAGMKE